jgi:hypothetical protein
MNRSFACLLTAAALSACAAIAQEGATPAPPAAAPADPAGAKPDYACDFEKIEPGLPPDDFMVLGGTFTVVQDGSNRVLELAGAPLDAFGILFGPAVQSKHSVSARARGTAKGKLQPAFGVGLNGVGGYRLQLSPMRRALEIIKGDAPVAAIPYRWESGTWTWFRFQVRSAGDKAWKVEGKAWPQGKDEPKAWMVAFDEKEEPPPGRPSVWGIPFSDLPIQFDDLRVAPATSP